MESNNQDTGLIGTPLSMPPWESSTEVPKGSTTESHGMEWMSWGARVSNWNCMLYNLNPLNQRLGHTHTHTNSWFMCLMWVYPWFCFACIVQDKAPSCDNAWSKGGGEWCTFLLPWLTQLWTPHHHHSCLHCHCHWLEVHVCNLQYIQSLPKGNWRQEPHCDNQSFVTYLPQSMAKIKDSKISCQEVIYFEKDGSVVTLASWGQKTVEQEIDMCNPQK